MRPWSRTCFGCPGVVESAHGIRSRWGVTLPYGGGRERAQVKRGRRINAQRQPKKQGGGSHPRVAVCSPVAAAPLLSGEANEPTCLSLAVQPLTRNQRRPTTAPGYLYSYNDAGCCNGASGGPQSSFAPDEVRRHPVPQDRLVVPHHLVPPGVRVLLDLMVGCGHRRSQIGLSSSTRIATQEKE